MKQQPPKWKKAAHTQAEKEYFKSIAERVRALRIKATGKEEPIE